jgi:flagellar basal-body rod protein FlgF
MENAALIGLSRQIALGHELDVIANNIANLNTTGYKADNAVFEEFLMPRASDGQFRSADRRISYVQDRATWHDFRPGPVTQTGSPLDIAIDGDAFLVVQTPRGERYTRNGALQIDSAGQLVTSEGYAVLGDSGPIQFQITDNNISISADGSVRVREGGNNRTDSARGQLRLVQFEQTGQLQKDGSSLFAAPNGMAPQPAQKVRVVQGTLEQSNVRPVVEMARMVEITRSYTQIASLLQQHSDMRRNAIDKLAEIPG